MKHLMIDLETLGTAVNCPVVAIGAVFFDPETGEMGAQFDCAIDIEDAMKFGRPSGSTVKWWLTQSDEARRKIARGQIKSQRAFTDFHGFIRTNSKGAVCPWGNGASFDISILDYAFPRILDLDAPWKFWDVRDCRTIKALAEGVVPDFAEPRVGVHHSALDDAIHQAKWVSYYWKALRYGDVTSAPKVAAFPLDL